MSRDARARATDLLNRIDAYAVDARPDCIEAEGDLLALRHACEGLTALARNHSSAAEFIELVAARMAEAVGLDD